MQLLRQYSYFGTSKARKLSIYVVGDAKREALCSFCVSIRTFVLVKQVN